MFTIWAPQSLLNRYINQLRSGHPGSELTPFPGGGGVPGILLTRIGFDQSRADFDRRVQDMHLAVEQAYWDLYCSYWVLPASTCASAIMR